MIIHRGYVIYRDISEQCAERECNQVEFFFKENILIQDIYGLHVCDYFTIYLLRGHEKLLVSCC